MAKLSSLSPAASIVVATKNRAENRKRQAVANEYSKKYPLSDNAETMQGYISAASLELRTIQGTIATTAGAKRVKKRNSDLLSNWIGVMKDQVRDIKSGISLATSVAAPIPPVMEQPQTDNVPRGTSGVVAASPSVGVLNTSPLMAQEASNLAAPTKKGMNWLLLGGFAVGAILLYRYLKK